MNSVVRESRVRSSGQNTMLRIVALPTAVLALGIYTARADDGLGLKRGGNPSEVSISGVSSGAAMAVQYAVAHSGSITAVGTIAGPAWGCADGRFSRAVNHCMCGRDALEIKIKTRPTTSPPRGRLMALHQESRDP